MGILGALSNALSPDYPHGNNGKSGLSSGQRHGSSGGHVQDGGTFGGSSTAG